MENIEFINLQNIFIKLVTINRNKSTDISATSTKL